MKTTDDQNELFDLVNEKDQVIGVVKRSRANSHKNLLHRAAGILVYNDKGELFMQKRSATKDVDPSTWTISASGHLLTQQNYDEAARRELREELGISAPLTFIKKYIVTSPHETEINAMYRTTHDGPFRLHPQEVETGAFFSHQDIETRIKTTALLVSRWTLVQLHVLCGILPERTDLKKYILKVF